MIKKQLIICISLLFFDSAFASNYIDKGYYVIDLKNKLEWLKCTTGQQWSDEKQTCLGYLLEQIIFFVLGNLLETKTCSCCSRKSPRKNICSRRSPRQIHFLVAFQWPDSVFRGARLAP